MSKRREKYKCPIHGAYAYSSEYDSFFCPECFQWMEDYCKCTAEDKDAGECYFPLTRPDTAHGQTDGL